MSYIGRQPQIGNFQICDAISTVNNQAAYTMQVGSVNVSPESANHMIVSLNGVIQKPNSSYTVSGATITFASNLVTGDVINFIQILGSVLDLGVPSDDTVTNAKLASGSFSNITGTGTLTSFRSTGIDDNSNALAMTIDSSENIGIGTNSPAAKLQVTTASSSIAPHASADEIAIENSANAGISILSGNSNEAAVYFGDSGDNDIGRIRYSHSENSMDFTVNAGVKVKIHSGGVMAAANGIALGVGTANTASNVLDDYEEGTWDATIACGSGSISLSASGNTCTYTKIGRTVQLNGSLTVSSVSSPSGDLLINGMPFASGSGEGGERATGAFCMYNPTNGTPPGLICQIFGGYASIRIESSGSADRSQADHVQVGSELRFTTNYQI